ncbi:MAG: T9SS C-terminal target domain-containing protein [Balneolaceae bacterium]|nr:MAG: T9SS C-terminal target domain-containing protein [Balneolaceae bacterium]
MVSEQMKYIPFLLFLAYLPAVATGQNRVAEFEIHARGNLWETVRDDGRLGAPDPNNRFQNFPSLDWPGGPTFMDKDDQRHYRVSAGLWIGGRRADNSIFFVENGPFQLVNVQSVQPMQKITNYIEDPGFRPEEAEETIIADFTTTENLRVVRKSRVWSFRGYTNMILYEYEIENSGSQNLTDVFVGFPNLLRPSYQDFVVHNGWGDDFNRVDDQVRFDPDRRLMYTWDDTPSFDLPSDVGNYLASANELRTTGYAGYAIVDYDPVSDGRQQPAAALYAQYLNNERFFTGLNTPVNDMYNLLNGTDTSLQADDDERLAPFMLMSVGPYNLGPGQKVRIVVAEAVNGIPQQRALLGLSAQPQLPAGLDSLRRTIDRAAALAMADFRVAAVPPPVPDITIIPSPSDQSVTIYWTPIEQSWVNPLDPSRTIRDYRVLRSSRSFIGPYEVLATIRPTRPIDITRYYDELNNRWVFRDESVSLGAEYYYAVTSVDVRNVESWMTNRNEEGIRAARDPAADAANVGVFPNPFRLTSGFPGTGQQNDIIFTNLPVKCTIRIYTSSGELVKEIRRDNPNSGEEAWNQLSDARQRPAPGIYFWTVSSDVGTATGTLLIIK